MGGTGKNKKGKRKPPSKKPTSVKIDHPIDDPMDKIAVQELVSTDPNPDPPQTPSISPPSPLTPTVYCSQEELYNLAVTKLQSSYFQSFFPRGDKVVAQTNSEFFNSRVRAGEDLSGIVKNIMSIMVHNLKQFRPSLSTGDIMWCLFTSNFDLATAKTLEVPPVTSNGKYPILDSEIQNRVLSVVGDNNDDDNNNNAKNLDKSSHEMKLLRRNVTVFAAFCRDTMNETPEETQALNASYPVQIATKPVEFFEEASLSEEDPEIVSRLVNDIREVKEKARERREWAQKTVIEAATKLGQELLAMRRLKRENKERAMAEYGGTGTELNNVKLLEARQNALAEMANETTQWNEAVKSLEKENAEIGAEIEAFKLRSSESEEKLAGVSKNGKRLEKKNVATEKQNVKLRRDIGEHREQSLSLGRELDDVKKAHEDVVVMRKKEEGEVREEAKNKLKEERRLKQEAEASVQRKLHELRREMDKDRRKYKDYIEFLERRLANLEMPREDGTGDSYQLPDHLFSWEKSESSGEKEAVGLDRACLFCLAREAEVVFLPCSHQVSCASCDEDRREILIGEAKCPCCEASIDQRIHVFGVRS